MRGSVGRDSTKHVDHRQDVSIEEQDVQNVGTQQDNYFFTRRW